jgi:hypothetical protein
MYHVANLMAQQLTKCDHDVFPIWSERIFYGSAIYSQR